jgi:hypothetical protein
MGRTLAMGREIRRLRAQSLNFAPQRLLRHPTDVPANDVPVLENQMDGN